MSEGTVGATDAAVDKKGMLEARPKELESRLFYAARNLAIEALLLRIENMMLREGLDVKALWKESSFGNPTLELQLKNPKPTPSGWEYASANVSVKRDTIRVYDRSLSDCFYSVVSVQSSEYWPWKVSKLVQTFRDLVEKLGADGYFTREVDKVNYPFDYDHHSSF